MPLAVNNAVRVSEFLDWYNHWVLCFIIFINLRVYYMHCSVVSSRRHERKSVASEGVDGNFPYSRSMVAQIFPRFVSDFRIKPNYLAVK
jgi:hypothetical protein